MGVLEEPEKVTYSIKRGQTWDSVHHLSRQQVVYRDHRPQLIDDPPGRYLPSVDCIALHPLLPPGDLAKMFFEWLVHLPEGAGDDMVLVGAVLLVVGPHVPEKKLVSEKTCA